MSRPYCPICSAGAVSRVRKPPVNKWSAAQVSEDGKDARVVIVRLLQVELGEDGRGVLSDRALGDEQPGRDRRVGPALRHELEDLALPGAQPTDRPLRR